MKHRILFPIIVVAIAASTALVRGQRFRAGIDVVSINVTVTDPANKFVRDLNQDDFDVFEDGVKQTIESFERVVDFDLRPLAYRRATEPACQDSVLVQGEDIHRNLGLAHNKKPSFASCKEG